VTQKCRIPPLIADHQATTDTTINAADMMNDQGLLQELPEITAMLQQASDYREQPAAADRILAGLVIQG